MALRNTRPARDSSPSLLAHGQRRLSSRLSHPESWPTSSSSASPRLPRVQPTALWTPLRSPAACSMQICYAYHHPPSQTQTVLSLLQLASNVPVLEYATHLHSVSWPSSVLTHPQSLLPDSPSSKSKPYTSSLSSSCSQIPMLESKLAVAKVFPDGAHATDRTVFVCTIHRDDPTAIEQVRAILFVKQNRMPWSNADVRVCRA